MIQGGGYTRDLVEKPTRPPIQNEATNGLRNARGTSRWRARARCAARRRSSTSTSSTTGRSITRGFSPDEFGYAVFGRVLAGMDVVDRDRRGADRHHAAGMDDVPVEP